MVTTENLAEMDNKELTEVLMSAALVRLKRKYGEDNEKISKMVKMESLDETIYSGDYEYPTQVDLDIQGVDENGERIYTSIRNTRISNALDLW